MYLPPRATSFGCGVVSRDYDFTTGALSFGLLPPGMLHPTARPYREDPDHPDGKRPITRKDPPEGVYPSGQLEGQPRVHSLSRATRRASFQWCVCVAVTLIRPTSVLRIRSPRAALAVPHPTPVPPSLLALVSDAQVPAPPDPVAASAGGRPRRNPPAARKPPGVAACLK
jgi:hypothetical protein